MSMTEVLIRCFTTRFHDDDVCVRVRAGPVSRFERVSGLRV